MTIDLSLAGTPKQPTIPENTFITIPAGAKYTYEGVPQTALYAVSIPSSAGCASFNQYFYMCYMMNPRVWQNAWSGDYDSYQDLVTDIIETEWDDDPIDGHNDSSLGG